MPQLRTIPIFLSKVIAVISVATAYAEPRGTEGMFDPKQAFCDRQTFALERMEEVGPWFDYIGGLRTARTEAPELNECPSSTIRAIYNIMTGFSSPDVAGVRSGFLQFYVGRGVQPELMERALDQSGSFRYLNDATLASLVWLTCPGTDNAQLECVRGIIDEFPTEFIETSPVFCDFALSIDVSIVEHPPEQDGTMILCAGAKGIVEPQPDAWLFTLDSALPR